ASTLAPARGAPVSASVSRPEIAPSCAATGAAAQTSKAIAASRSLNGFVRMEHLSGSRVIGPCPGPARNPRPGSAHRRAARATRPEIARLFASDGRREGGITFGTRLAGQPADGGRPEPPRGTPLHGCDQPPSPATGDPIRTAGRQDAVYVSPHEGVKMRPPVGRPPRRRGGLTAAARAFILAHRLFDEPTAPRP